MLFACMIGFALAGACVDNGDITMAAVVDVDVDIDVVDVDIDPAASLSPPKRSLPLFLFEIAISSASSSCLSAPVLPSVCLPCSTLRISYYRSHFVSTSSVITL